MARVGVVWVKKLNTDAVVRNFDKSVGDVMLKQSKYMKDEVEINIVKHRNIDTGTLISNIKYNVEQSGDMFDAVVEADTSSHPDNHPPYSIALEDGTARTQPYPNFRPALAVSEPIAFKALTKIRIHD